MSGLKDQFLKAPLIVRRAAVAVQGAKNRAARYGKFYEDHLRLLSTSDRWSEEEQRAYQSSELRKLLREAKTGTDYYAHALGAYAEEELDDIARDLQLGALPILDKPTLKDRTPDFYNRHRKTALVSSTSGTSGKSMAVEYDTESIQRRFAFMHRQRLWAGATDLRSYRAMLGTPARTLRS